MVLDHEGPALLDGDRSPVPGRPARCLVRVHHVAGVDLGGAHLGRMRGAGARRQVVVVQGLLLGGVVGLLGDRLHAGVDELVLAAVVAVLVAAPLAGVLAAAGGGLLASGVVDVDVHVVVLHENHLFVEAAAAGNGPGSLLALQLEAVLAGVGFELARVFGFLRGISGALAGRVLLAIFEASQNTGADVELDLGEGFDTGLGLLAFVRH